MSIERSAEQLADKRGYYGLPILKRPHWKWEIVLYFWIGGIASGAYVVAALADLVGDEHDQPIARAGRFVALPLILLSPLLLIKDLGRPEKFLNMLRVLKLKSPMSVGSWVLGAFGAFSGLSVLLELFYSGPRWHWARRLVGALGLPWALLLGGYTGVLLAATAVPLWWRNRLLWGPTFLASAFSSGTAAIQAVLALSNTGNRSAHVKLERVHVLGLLAESTLLVASLRTLGPAGRLLTRGRWSTLFVPGKLGLGLAIPLALSARPGHQRWRTLLSALCTLLGGLIFRACIVYGGQTSADEAGTYLAQTAAAEQ